MDQHGSVGNQFRTSGELVRCWQDVLKSREENPQVSGRRCDPELPVQSIQAGEQARPIERLSRLAGGVRGGPTGSRWFCLMVVWDGCSGSRPTLAWRLGSLAVPSIVVLVGVQAGPSGWAPERAAKTEDLATRRSGRNRRAGRPGDGSGSLPVSLGSDGHRLVAEPGGRPLSGPARGSRCRGAGAVPIAGGRGASPAATGGVSGPSACGEASRSLPPANRDFHMMVRDGDVASASNYLAVQGVLRAVGKRVQVYVAAEDLRAGGIASCSSDLVATFDEQILPVAARSFGLAARHRRRRPVHGPAVELADPAGQRPARRRRLRPRDRPRPASRPRSATTAT